MAVSPFLPVLPHACGVSAKTPPPLNEVPPWSRTTLVCVPTQHCVLPQNTSHKKKTSREYETTVRRSATSRFLRRLKPNQNPDPVPLTSSNPYRRGGGAGPAGPRRPPLPLDRGGRAEPSAHVGVARSPGSGRTCSRGGRGLCWQWAWPGAQTFKLVRGSRETEEPLEEISTRHRSPHPISTQDPGGPPDPDPTTGLIYFWDYMPTDLFLFFCCCPK